MKKKSHMDDDQRKAMFANIGNMRTSYPKVKKEDIGKGYSTAPNVIPEYKKPNYRKMEKENAENVIKNMGGVKKIGNNMWAYPPYKEKFQACHTQTVIMKTPDGFYQFDVPTDASGMMNERVIAARILDVADGDREGRIRSVFMDVGITADTNTDAKDKEKRDEVYRWYLHPNESDIKNMDDENSKISEILKETKTGKRSILISGGTKEQRDAIAKTIEQNFTVAEKKLIAGNLITIGNTPSGIAGYYSQHTDSYQKPIGVAEIRVGSEYANEKGGDVVIHEAIHLLRDHDASRDPHLRATKKYYGRDADLEESLTEAETVGRQKPLTKHITQTGYYRYVMKDKDTGQVIIDDRIIVTTPKDKTQFISSGKKGKSVQRAVLTHYPNMAISKLKNKGDSEAIDSYYHIENRKGHVEVQTYAPGQTAKGEKQEDKRMKASGRVVKKWNDGKLEKI